MRKFYFHYNPDEDYVEVEAKLWGHLESFLETARSFNMIYTKEIRPWTHMMEVPLLHGFGPAANRLLEAYKTLLKTRNATGLVALAIAVGLGSLTHTLGTLVRVIGASGFATATAAIVVETVVGSFR
ncbi:hypothetical protein TEA_026872 [Camellia sinensis var. sinensis]|uniref:Uncharacterized protein n=1 Tax=Camellia sinensis var. sinensis TaxID=542762 RepID=A0A4S4DQE7_CAMSN|nr:hypothetical protein TEA_026872 [Camellia sinensis var. sinensis]